MACVEIPTRELENLSLSGDVNHHISSDIERFAITSAILTKTVIEKCGPAYWKLVEVLKNGDNEVCDDSDLSSSDEEDEDEPENEDDMTYLKSLDPALWQEQDHYAVLGLKLVRFNATEQQIKKAYRKKVLHHHPDKRRACGENVKNDDYFSCITKAYEILGNPVKRRSYDSVDPEFDDSIPQSSERTKSHFYEIFTPVFEQNSRWSEKQRVPQLGTPDSSRDEVESFYAFWYNFESWREYSYLDEEEKEKGQDRDTRKYIDKKNKADRAKRKKEEMSRIRTLVDMAYNLDPRIQKFKQEDKERKLAQKKARQDAARARQEEEDKKRREAEEKERREREQQEAEERAKQEVLKKEREELKRALKKAKKMFRTLCKDNGYFGSNDAEVVTHMANVEKMCEQLSLQEIEEMNKNLQSGVEGGDGRSVFLNWMEETERKLEKERQEMMQQGGRASPGRGQSASSAPWNTEDLQLLIKAVNLFPAGTNQRWEVVANFINQHNSNASVQRNAKEVLAKAKDLQTSDHSKNALREAANKKAYDIFEKTQKPAVKIDAKASERFDTPAEQQGQNSAPWTTGEQQLLEQALKTYPSNTPERWDKIASCIPTRSKKDCMKRYKELVELVKAKKAAQAATKDK